MNMKKRICFLFLTLSLYTLSYAQHAKVSLLFAGDAMQHQSQLDGAKTKQGYDYSSYFKQIEDRVDSVDIAVVNFETTLPGKAYTGYPCFGSPDAYAYALRDAGFDVFLTANNHSLDKGRLGVERTIEMLDSMQIKHLGTYVNTEKRDIHYPMMLIKNGIRIAMLNYTYGTNGFEVRHPNVINLIDRKQIAEDIQIAKYMNPDIIVANIHWGDEYKLQPNKMQKDLADFLIKNGVRLVIGAHPHVVQPIDIQKKGDAIQNIVAYSLGNFISGMKVVNTDGGMMVRIDLSKDNEGNVSIDTCSYSLVWVHKPLKDNKLDYQLIPVEKYTNHEGRALLGEIAYQKMDVFARSAKKAIESMWNRVENIK
jgi:poly-gamma-glutamate synthesis protein (capsule biosynthesis protein)